MLEDEVDLAPVRSAADVCFSCRKDRRACRYARSEPLHHPRSKSRPNRYTYDPFNSANILPDELLEFRKLAAAYARMTVSEVNVELRNGDLLEICHDE